MKFAAKVGIKFTTYNLSPHEIDGTRRIYHSYRKIDLYLQQMRWEKCLNYLTYTFLP